jgi:hypothetical protein
MASGSLSDRAVDHWYVSIEQGTSDYLEWASAFPLRCQYQTLRVETGREKCRRSVTLRPAVRRRDSRTLTGRNSKSAGEAVHDLLRRGAPISHQSGSSPCARLYASAFEA